MKKEELIKKICDEIQGVELDYWGFSSATTLHEFRCPLCLHVGEWKEKPTMDTFTHGPDCVYNLAKQYTGTYYGAENEEK